MKITNYGQSVLYKIYAFLVYLAPMLALFFCNMDEYTNDATFSFFGIVLLGFIVIAFCGTIKKIFNYNLGLSVSAIIFIVALIAKYLGEQLLLISGCSFVGSALALIFGAISNTYYRIAFITDDKGRKRKDTSQALPLKEIWKETLYITYNN
jgi:hypothetical protein